MPISNFVLHFVWWLFDVSVFSSVITAAAPELIQTLEYFGLRRNNRLSPFLAYHCASCLIVTVFSSVPLRNLDIYGFTIQVLLEVTKTPFLRATSFPLLPFSEQFSFLSQQTSVQACLTWKTTTKCLHPAVGNDQFKTIIVCSKREIYEIESDWTFRIVWNKYASLIATETAEFSHGILKLNRDLTLHHVSHCTVQTYSQLSSYSCRAYVGQVCFQS